MTFGKVLQELTMLCGVKHCNLADELGYDPSYISRWINGVKLPALRNNDALFTQIATYLTKNADSDIRSRIAGQFNLDCDDMTDESFSQALSSMLAATHAQEHKKRTPTTEKTGKENAIISPVKDVALFPESIFTVLQQMPPAKRLDMICTTPIHIQFKNNDSFFGRVTDILPAGMGLRVIQFIDMDDFGSRTDISCRSFCYLMGLGGKIRYEFYGARLDRTSYVYLIRDGLLIQYIREPFSKEVYLLESGDRNTISRYCSSVDAYIRDRLPFAKPINVRQLVEKQYFIDFLIQPHCRCLLGQMQPFFFPETLKKKFIAMHPGLEGEMQLFFNGSSFFESVLIYQLALVNYIYTGRLMVLGTLIVVPPEERLQHLKNMAAQLKSASGKVYILSTQNNICNYNDLSVSLFTNQHTAFALNMHSDQNQLVYTISSTAMVKQLNAWLNHMQKLPPEQCLTGQEAADYITRCMHLL
jgi:hypothetical protein